jgi:3-hydroxyisobutyrate dehydrogenase
MHVRIGFIGFGEAGFTIGNGLRSAGLEQLVAYDIATDSADRGPLIQERARKAGARLVDSPAELAGSCDLLMSTVTSSSALDAARQHAPFLTPRHVYADLNSVSPALKCDIDGTVTARGAAFVEVAVMAPVSPYGHAVPMLLGGPAAHRFVDLMAPFGMRMQVLESSRVGSAAAVKMCRSIVVKGIEALLCECVLGATQYDADGHVFASLNETWPGIDWKSLADYTMGRLVVHGERRAREMEEVAETLRAIGVDPIMAEATARRHEWSAAQNLKAQFGPYGPRTYQDVIDVLVARRRPRP